MERDDREFDRYAKQVSKNAARMCGTDTTSKVIRFFLNVLVFVPAIAIFGIAGIFITIVFVVGGMLMAGFSPFHMAHHGAAGIRPPRGM